MISLKKIDDFIERQGIKSSELCIILDRIEQEIQRLEAKNKVLMEAVVYYKERFTDTGVKFTRSEYGEIAEKAIKKCESIDKSLDEMEIEND